MPNPKYMPRPPQAPASANILRIVPRCHPDARDDMTAPVHELTNDEWAALVERHALTLEA